MADKNHGERYPEHARLCAVKDESQVIGHFLEWLQESDLVICGANTGGEEDRRRIEQLLADYFEIDLREIANEKDAMYEELARSANA